MDTESEIDQEPTISNALSILSYSFPLCPVPPPTPTQSQPPSLLTTTTSSSKFTLNDANQTIPIYQLQQTSTSLISQNNDASKLYVSTGEEDSKSNEWSLIKPASRFAITNRRECKSTSDDTFTFDLSSQAGLNSHSLVSPTRSASFSLSRSLANGSRNNNNDDWLLTSVNSISSGRFGFNPVSFYILKLFND